MPEQQSLGSDSAVRNGNVAPAPRDVDTLAASRFMNVSTSTVQRLRREGRFPSTPSTGSGRGERYVWEEVVAENTRYWTAVNAAAGAARGAGGRSKGENMRRIKALEEAVEGLGVAVRTLSQRVTELEASGSALDQTVRGLYQRVGVLEVRQ